MRMGILAASGFVLASLTGASASAETVRYPANGNPALIISVPSGWTHKPVPTGGQLATFAINSPHGIEVVALIVPYPGTPEMYAQQMANVSHLQMQNPKATQFLGCPGFMFDGAYTTFGTPFTVHFVQAKVDNVHLALIEVRSPVTGPSAKEIEEGRQVLEHLKLASAAVSSADGFVKSD
jgi:hypothetical protein